MKKIRLASLFLSLLLSVSVLGMLSSCKSAHEELLTSEYYEDGEDGAVGSGNVGDDADDADDADDDADDGEDGTEGNTGSKTGSKTGSGKSSGNTSSKSTIAPLGKVDLGGAEVTIGGWGEGGGAPSKDSATYKQEIALQAAIEKKYNCKIKYVYVVDNMQYTDAVITAAMAGKKYADIVWVTSDRLFPTFVLRNYIQPLDSVVDINLPQWNKEVTDYMTYNSKHYALTPHPFDAGNGIWFNKEIFSKFNAKTPYDYVDSNTWTWNNFLAAAQGTTKMDGGVQYYGVGGRSNSLVEPLVLIKSNGASPVKKVSGKETFNLDDPACIAAIKFGFDLYNEHKVVAPDNDFTKGKIAMTFGGWFSMAADAELKSMGSKVGFTYLPKGPNVSGYCTDTWNLSVACIPSAVKNPEVIGQIMTEFYAPQSWRPTREQHIQSYMPDKKALQYTVDMEKRSSSKQLYAFYNWYIPEVLWTDMGIRNNIQPQTYVESIKESAQKDISDLWAGK